MRIMLAQARCCGDPYPVVLGWRMGTCGLCGKPPTIDADQLYESICISLEPIDERRVQDDRPGAPPGSG